MAKDNTLDTKLENELVQCIVQEVDEARDVYALAAQLAPLLPIASFDDLKKLPNGTIMFRRQRFELDQFRDRIPAVIFPVRDIQSLVVLLQHAVRGASAHTAESPKDPEVARRLLRRISLGMLPVGQLGPPALAFRSLGPNNLPEAPPARPTTTSNS
jgi:hypothetical protein